jgi:hypothetical protein
MHLGTDVRQSSSAFIILDLDPPLLESRLDTTIEQAFGPAHLSRRPLDPGPMKDLIPGPVGV